jgi:hypothetical protein
MVPLSRRRCFPRLLSVGFFALAVSLVAAQAQDADQGPPIVAAAAMPLYPTIAVAARVEGVVKIRVTTNGKSVASLQTLSGSAMLVQEAKKDIQTWTFDQHSPTTFVTTFEYHFEDPPSCTYTNSEVTARLPLEVHVNIRRLQTCDPAATVTTTRGGRSKKD